MKKLSMMLVLVAGVFLAAISCKKEDSPKLGGETDLDLTKVGVTTDLYVKSDNGNFPAMSMVVKSNNDGDVTYTVLVDFKGHPDSAALVNIIPNHLLDDQNRFHYDVKLRVTSEGYQDYINDESTPFTLVKYDDNVGATYNYTLKDGTKLTRTVTEKTGLNDWFFDWMYIKTSEVTQTSFSPVADAVFKTLKFRFNHRFGLVYMEAELENGVKGSVDLVANF